MCPGSLIQYVIYMGQYDNDKEVESWKHSPSRDTLSSPRASWLAHLHWHTWWHAVLLQAHTVWVGCVVVIVVCCTKIHGHGRTSDALLNRHRAVLVRQQ